MDFLRLLHWQVQYSRWGFPTKNLDTKSLKLSWLRIHHNANAIVAINASGQMDGLITNATIAAFGMIVKDAN